MEKLFEIVTPYSYDEYVKLNRFHMYKKDRTKFILLIACIALILFSAISIMILGSSTNNYIFGTLYLVADAIFIYWLIRAPQILSKRILKTDSLLNNVTNTIDLYEDYLETTNDQGNSKLNYDQIFKVYETNDNFYIYINKLMAYMISKKDFRIGNSEDLRKFLTNKLGTKFIIKY